MNVPSEELRREMQQNVEDLQKQMAALHWALSDARREAQLLREWREAHNARVKAQHEMVAAWCKLQIERAWQSERDPALPLQ